MKKFCSALMFLFPFSLLAQSGAIEGMVKDKLNNIPLNGVTVNVQSTAKADISDQFGKFSIKDVNPGNYELVIMTPGYKSETIPVEVKKDITSSLQVTLHLAPLHLSTVTITGKRNSNLNSIAAIDIKLRPVTNSQDILRIVPGLFIAQHAGGGKADQLFLRGYNIDHGTDIAETVDGMPVNMVSHAHGQGYADLHFLIPELVEKVDFDKGPFQTNKGNFATAGWVDFKTKDFLSSNNIKVEAGKYDYKRITGLFKLLNKEKDQTRQQLYIGSEYFKNNSFFDDPQNFHRLNVFTKYSLLKENSRFFISASTFDSKWNASGQIPDRTVKNGIISRSGSIDNSEGGHTSRTNINARLIKEYKKGWRKTDQVYFSNYQFNLFSNFTFYLNDPINGDGIQQKENRNVFGYTGTVSKNYSIRSKHTTTELGYGARHDNVRNIELNQVSKRKFIHAIRQGEVRELNGFAYLNHNMELTDKLNINAGIRYDHFHFSYKDLLHGDQNFKKQLKAGLHPKMNISYTVSNSMRITLSNGIGFHSNDSRLILDQEAKDILPKVYGTDLGFMFKPKKNLVLKTTFWHLYSQQEFVYVGDEGIVEPSGKTRRIGIDVSARYQPFRWLFFDMDANYARPRAIGEEKGNDYVPLAPVFTSIGGITVKTGKGFSGSLRYRQMNDRPANENNSVIADGYFITDALANYTYKKIELSLSIENLFNKKWNEAQFDTRSRLKHESEPVSEIHFTPGTPRFLKIGIALNF